MLTKRMRRLLEFHFYNHKADRALFDERRADIMESGLCANLNRSGSGGAGGSPTESKAIRIEALYEAIFDKKDWEAVVTLTEICFDGMKEGEIMRSFYAKKIPLEISIQIFKKKGISRSTFLRMRDSWLDRAIYFANKFDLSYS